MRFMLIRKADKETEAGVMPSRELLTAMGAYMEEMGQAGILLGGEGLKATSHGVRVKFSGGKPQVIRGPFGDPAQLVAGYCLIEVPGVEEAIGWLRRWPALDVNGEVELELRPLLEAEDFGAEFTPEMQAAEDRLRAEIARK